MITHVAIRVNGVTVWRLPRPNRHHHIIHLRHELTGESTDGGEEQGFLDQTGKFYDRVDALYHVLLHDQVKNKDDIRAGMLFSEDLW